MKSATAGGPYRVPKEENGWRSLAMAAAMHAGLLLFLWIGVAWQNNEPVAVEAEVWDMAVQQAAPAPTPEPEPEPEPEPAPRPAPQPTPPPAKVAPPVEAPPPAREPDIALEKRKAREKAEKDRLTEEKRLAKQKQEEEEDQARKLAEKKAKELEQKKLEEKKLEEKKLADEKAKEEKAKEEKKKAEKLAKAKAEAEQKKADERREAEIKRMTSMLGNGAAGSTGSAAKSTAPRADAGYQAAIRAKVQGNISYSGSKQDIEAVFRVTQLPTGEILSVRKVKSSGNPVYDAAVERAIGLSSPLPKKKDGTVERELDLVFNLKDMP